MPALILPLSSRCTLPRASKPGNLGKDNILKSVFIIHSFFKLGNSKTYFPMLADRRVIQPSYIFTLQQLFENEPALFSHENRCHVKVEQVFPEKIKPKVPQTL